MTTLRSILLISLVAWSCALGGCSGDRPPPIGDYTPDGGLFGFDVADDLGTQRFDIVPIDRPPQDVQLVDVRTGAAAGARCVLDSDCQSGLVCLDGLCAIDECMGRSPCNPSTERCVMRCVATRDRCAGRTCGATQTCLNGRCEEGCFPPTCAGVTCDVGQFCDDRTGTCTAIRSCGGRCEDGACHFQCVPRSPCDGRTCAPGETCNGEGNCVANPCASVNCGAGSVCVSGRCINTCACDPPCTRSPRDRCIVGQCVCERRCPPGSMCGADDGCGGRCVGPCPTRFEVCDTMSTTCVCTPSCPATAPCGSSDGCGGRCDSGCGLGERCDVPTGRCLCTPHCPPAEMVADYPCGVTIPNLCMGEAACGTGTGCPTGRHCSAEMRCVSDDPDDAGSDDAGSMGDGGDGGGGCPGGRTMCEDGCYNLQTNNNRCGACDNRCPADSTCVAGVCTCPTGLTLCDGRCVNTRGDQTHCGACNSPCPDLSACTDGMCRCVPHCETDASNVACGMPVPNACAGGPSCGIGRQCPTGSLCNVLTGTCNCVPFCPPGVACGIADGCGGSCRGSCNTGETCAADPMDPTRFGCSAAGCVGGCRCNERCDTTVNRCVPVTCANGTSPCPCSCCAPGFMCVGGVTCAPIPP